MRNSVFGNGGQADGVEWLERHFACARNNRGASRVDIDILVVIHADRLGVKNGGAQALLQICLTDRREPEASLGKACDLVVAAFK